MNNGILHDYHGKMSMSGQIKIQEHKMQMRPARCVALPGDGGDSDGGAY